MGPELQSELEKTVQQVHEKWAALIEKEWRPKPLTSSCPLVLATQGIEPGEVSIGSVLHAQLVVNLKMAKEWGWGFGDALCTLGNGENRIEQAGMSYIKEVLAVLEDAFDRTCPRLNRSDLVSSPVFLALKEAFIEDVHYRLAAATGEGSKVPALDGSPWESKVDQTVQAILGQIETGYNAILNPEKPDSDSRTTPDPVIETTGNSLVVTLASAGQVYQAAITLKSQDLALAAKENHDLHMAMIWKLTENMDSERALEIIEHLRFKFSPETERFQEKHDLTTEQVSDIILQSIDGRLTLQ